MQSSAAADWIATGGAYWIIGFAWVLSAAFYYFVAEYVGRMTRTENDGCLLGIMNILLTLGGGGAGLLAFRTQFPLFVATSVLGAITLPAMGTLFVVWRMKVRGVR